MEKLEPKYEVGYPVKLRKTKWEKNDDIWYISKIFKDGSFQLKQVIRIQRYTSSQIRPLTLKEINENFEECEPPRWYKKKYKQ